MDQKKERRKYPRIKCMIPVTLMSMNSQVLLTIENFSENGLMGYGEHPIEEGTKFCVEIALGHKQEHQLFRITGILLRCKEVEKEGKRVYNIAVLFLNMTQDERQKLIDFIQKENEYHGRKNPDPD